MHIARTIALGLLLASCSDEGAPDEPEESTGERMDAGVVIKAQDAGRPRDAMVRSDAGRKPPTIPMQCEPGRYEGTFLCAIIGIVPWFGRMQFDLVENQMGAGEFTTLSIAAGTRITSDLDSMGGTFSADLNAEFDCRTGVISGELANGIYLLGSIMPWNFNGPMEGNYRLDDAGVPGFEGTLGTLMTPDLWFYGPLAPTGDCEWSAARVLPDAGSP